MANTKRKAAPKKKSSKSSQKRASTRTTRAKEVESAVGLDTAYSNLGKKSVLQALRGNKKLSQVLSKKSFQQGVTLLQRLGIGVNVDTLQTPYSQSAWVYAAVNAIALNLSRVPFEVFEKVTTDDEEPRKVENPENKWVKLFRKPNPLMDGMQLWEATATYQHLEGGECLWIMSGTGVNGTRKPGEIPTEIWPVSGKGYTEVVENGVIVGWELKDSKGKMRTLPHSAVIQHKFFNPNKPLRGLSPLEAAMLGLSTSFQASLWNRMFFENNADPGGILTVDGDVEMDAETRDDMRAQWEDRHRGTMANARVSVLEGGVEYTPLKVNNKEMQFLEQLEWSRNEILAIYKTPPSVVGIFDNMGGLGGEGKKSEAERGFWQDNLVPKMRGYAAMVNMRLLSEVENGRYFGMFDTTAIKALQDDLSERLEQAKQYQDLGYPLNMINKRLSLGMEDVEWGDQAYTQMTQVPYTAIQDGPVAQPESTDSTDSTEDEEEERSVGFATNRQIKKPETDQEKLTFWRSYNRDVLEPNEKRYRGKISRYLFAQRRDQLARLEDPEARHPANRGMKHKQEGEETIEKRDIPFVLFSMDDWNSTLKDTTRPLYTKTALDSLDRLQSEVGNAVTFDPTDDRIINFLSRKEIMVQGINVTTRERLRNQLIDGVEQNETISQLQERVRRVFNGRQKQSLTIARTETAATANGVRFEAAKAEGIEKHEWITAQDDVVRPTHLENQAQGAIKVGDKFAANGLRYPNDPLGSTSEVINCRCVAVLVV